MQDVDLAVRPRLEVWTAVTEGYRLAATSVAGLPGATVVAIALLLAMELTLLPARTLGRLLLIGIVAGIALAPYAILIHRRLILNDAAGNYLTAAISARVIPFAVAAGVANMVHDLFSALTSGSIAVEWGRPIGAVGLIVMAFFVSRLLLGFPAIATDGEAPFDSSWKTTRGSTWRVLWVFMLASVPLFVITLVLTWLAARSGIWWVVAFEQSVVGSISAAVYVSLASHLYRTRADWSRASPV